MNVLNSDRQKSGSPASCRKLESPTNAGGERMSHCVRLKSSETTIGPAVNARNPMIHGETNNKPTRASRFARGDIPSLGPPRATPTYCCGDYNLLEASALTKLCTPRIRDASRWIAIKICGRVGGKARLPPTVDSLLQKRVDP